MKKSVSGALVIGVVLTLILTLMTRIGLMPFLKLLNTPEDILPEAYEYSSCIMLFMGVTLHITFAPVFCVQSETV